MPSLLIYQEADNFDIRERNFAVAIAEAIDMGSPLYWNRKGLVGKVPVGVLRDTAELFVACEKMRQRGRIVDLPATAFTITWDQTEDRRPESASNQTE